jgi:hypothetical protein
MKNAILKTLAVAVMAVSANAFADVGGDFESKVNLKAVTQIGIAGQSVKQKLMVGSSEGKIGGNFKSEVNAGAVTQIGIAGKSVDQTLLLGSAAK